MWKTMSMTIVVLVLIAGACATDATESDEYQQLENELAAVEQELADTAAELAAVQAVLDEAASSDAEVPAEVVAVLDEWRAAAGRNDGSIVDLYLPTGYHLFGTQLIPLESLNSHLTLMPGWTSEWISEPYLVAAEPEGRYVVTRGVRNSSSSMSLASALTFEIVTRDGELKIAETDWTDVTT